MKKRIKFVTTFMCVVIACVSVSPTANLTSEPIEGIYIEKPAIIKPSEKEDISQTHDIFREVDDAYFDNAVFIGNSITEGLRLYGGINNASFICDIGLKVSDVFTTQIKVNDKYTTVIDQLKIQNFDKLYLLFGSNELGWVYPENFIKRYEEFIGAIRYINPEATIIVQSITPVSRKRNENDKIYNNHNIQKFNALMVDMCDRIDVVYLDVGEFLKDDNGNLIDEATKDGVHLIPEYCKKWHEFLKQKGV